MLIFIDTFWGDKDSLPRGSKVHLFLLLFIPFLKNDLLFHPYLLDVHVSVPQQEIRVRTGQLLHHLSREQTHIIPALRFGGLRL